MKKLLKLVIGLVLLLLVALFAVGFFADGIAKEAIETGGTYALGVDTAVDGVDIAFLGGTFTLDGLAVANPEGYGDGRFLELGQGSLDVATMSLFSDRVDVDLIDLSGIRVNLVQGLQASNYGKILENLERFQGGDAAGGAGSAAADSGDEKRFLVKKLRMSDIQVVVVPVPELNLAAVTVPIDEIVLEDIGTESDKGVLLSDLAGIVVESILTRASATGNLPNMIQGTLDGQLGQLHGLTDAGVGALEGILPGEAKPAVDAAKDALGEGLRGLGIGK